MPKVTIEFNLPEEQPEYNVVHQAGKMMACVDDFKNFLRNKCKHGDGEKIDWDEVRDEFFKHFEDINWE